jgi:hypothetical protein
VALLREKRVFGAGREQLGRLELHLHTDSRPELREWGLEEGEISVSGQYSVDDEVCNLPTCSQLPSSPPSAHRQPAETERGSRTQGTEGRRVDRDKYRLSGAVEKRLGKASQKKLSYPERNTAGGTELGEGWQLRRKDGTGLGQKNTRPGNCITSS